MDSQNTDEEESDVVESEVVDGGDPEIQPSEDIFVHEQSTVGNKIEFGIEGKSWRRWVMFGASALVAVLIAGFVWTGIARQPSEMPELTAQPLTPVRSANTLVVGSISPDDAKGEIEEFQPFIDYVVTQLADQEINRGEVLVAANVAEMAQLIRQGEVDIFIDSPFPAFAVDRLVGTKPLVTRWKMGVEKIHSVVFVKSGSEFKDANDLKGATIAFEEPNSTSGYFLPRAILEQAGLTLSQQPEGGTDGDIRYVFTFDEESIVDQVRSGALQAGAMSQETLSELTQGIDNEFDILLISPEVYRHLVTVRSDMDAELVEALEKVLVTMHENEQGLAVLKKFSRTAKFTLFAEDFSAYKGIESLIELVEKEIVRQ